MDKITKPLAEAAPTAAEIAAQFLPSCHGAVHMALEAARDWIAEERRVYLEADETADVDAADLALALIDAALAEPVNHIPDAGKKVFIGTLQWENNTLYAGKLKVGTTWPGAAGQGGYFVLTGIGASPPNIASEAEARAALEDALLALGDSHGDAS